MPGHELGSGMMGEGRARDLRGAYRALFQYSMPYLPLLLLAMAFSALATVLNLAGPTLLKEVADRMLEGIHRGSFSSGMVTGTLYWLLLFYALAFFLGTCQGILTARLTKRLTLSLRTALSQKLSRLPLSYYDRHSTGDILSRVTNDVDLIGQALNQSLGMALSSVLTFLGTLLIMLYTNWLLAIAAVLSTFLGMGGMRFLVARSQSYFLGQQRLLGSLNGYAEECYRGHSLIKAYGGEGKAFSHFSLDSQRLYENSWKSQFLSGLMEPMMGLVGSFSYVLVSVLGAVLVLKGRSSFGVVVAFMLYIRMFTQPLTNFAEVSAMLQSVAAASERVFQFLKEREMPPEEGEAFPKEQARGAVSFQNVSFSYRTEWVLKDISIDVLPGQRIAIVGQTGAGKTTLVNLLLRFYAPQAGEIHIDGRDIRGIPREEAHRLFAVVLQDPCVFSATVLENLFMREGEDAGRFSEAERERAEMSCRAVGLHPVILRLPEAYDTVLDAAALSQGERQLLSIARALLRDAPMLILDEATSAVDSLTEKRVQEAMDRLMQGRTSFIIAHRLSTIVNADQILVLKDGEIVESGRHEALLSRQGVYAELYWSGFSE